MKNNETTTTLYMSKELKAWIKKEAKANDRSSVAQIRRYLELIKAGKINVVGAG